MKLAELNVLFGAVPSSGARNDYVAAILNDNVLAKKAATARRKAVQHLSELYALDPAVPLFHVFRHYWDLDNDGRPLSALLCACARDPLLRLTAPAILSVPEGVSVGSADIEKAIAVAAPGKYTPVTQSSISRNARSSWTQSGHLRGKYNKLRTHPKLTPANTAFALALGHLAGVRGNMLFHTFWTGLLDAPEDRIKDMAIEASRRGWLTYRGIGSTVEVRFPATLIKPAEVPVE
jgi:hypothetical protein